MAKTEFKITYRDPKSITPDSEGDLIVESIEFEDSTHWPFTTAREWAEDYAYTMADKGWYTVEEVDD